MKEITISVEELQAMAKKLHLPLDPDVLEATRATVESWTNGSLKLAEKMMDPRFEETTPISVVKHLK